MTHTSFETGGLVGAASYFIDAAFSGKFTWGGLAGSTVSGAISGAVAGTGAGLGFLASGFVGAGTNAVGSLVEQVGDKKDTKI